MSPRHAFSALVALGAVVSTPALAGDAAAGAALFKQRCQICHVTTPGQKPTLAPNLAGVVGRAAGSTDYTMYSPALKAYGKPWTPALLESWLMAPAKLVPGTKMVIAVPVTKERDDIIAYLGTLKK